jgi:putative oxidoreductase
MAMQTVDTHELITPSPTVFAGIDGLAMRSGDLFVLVGRLMVGWLFFKAGWDKLMNMPGFVGYLTNLKMPSPEFWAWPGMLGELLIGIALILGIATRYTALITIAYLIFATALAHRYWQYPAQMQGNQFAHFLKNIAIMAGAICLFVTGAGRFSVDGWLRRNGR